MIRTLLQQDWLRLGALGFVAGVALTVAGQSRLASAAERPIAAPAPLFDSRPATATETAVFAGGCFWGVEGVFSHVKGVTSAVSGYAGGDPARKVGYEQVGSGRTGHAESVRVTYDPRRVSYGTLLRVFFSVIADPTTLNSQGPDQGTQYRSALFPTTPEQARVAKAYLAQLSAAKLWKAPIVTRIEPFRGFQPAEDHHQNFMRRNPDHPYILRWDRPKLSALQALYPALYQPRPAA
jgi:peptide-methionine (S)-S-oxide reductase